MAVYIDDFYLNEGSNFGRMKMSHMVADKTEELCAMAETIGVNPKWIQDAGTPREHFDVSMGCRLKAIEQGAIPIGMRTLAAMTRDRQGPNETMTVLP